MGSAAPAANRGGTVGRMSGEIGRLLVAPSTGRRGGEAVPGLPAHPPNHLARTDGLTTRSNLEPSGKPGTSHGDHPRLAGHPNSARARAHARLVASIFSENNSSKALVMFPGGPHSMMPLSGRPWLGNGEKPR